MSILQSIRASANLPRHRPRLFRPDGRRLDRHLRLAELRTRLGRRPDRTWRRIGARACEALGADVAQHALSNSQPERGHASTPLGAADPPQADAMVTTTPGHRARHPHGRLRAGAVRRCGGRRDRRRPCRLERRAGRRHRSDHRGDGNAGRASARELPPPSVPASARRITKWARSSAHASSATGSGQCPILQQWRPGGSLSVRSGRLMSPTGWRAPALAKVTRLSACTYAREADFFSFRRATHRGETDYGREISAIVLR